MHLIVALSCDKFYNLPSMKSNVKAGIGYGTKYDFTKFTADVRSFNLIHVESFPELI